MNTCPSPISRRDALRQELNALRQEAKPKRDPEEVRLEAYKTRTKNRIADIRERIAREDYTVEERKSLGLDDEAIALKAELEKAQTQRDAMFHEIETLRGKTGHCIGCEMAAQKLAKLREAGEKVAKWLRDPKLGRWTYIEGGEGDFYGDVDEMAELLEAAVGGGEESNASV